jgi:hypothetical protein
MKMITGTMHIMLPAILMSTAWILAITRTEAASPINNGFKQISKTIKVPKHHPQNKQLLTPQIQDTVLV